MSDKQKHVILEEDIFALTAQGHNELSGSGTSLSPAELEVLVLIDGKSTAGETASRTRTLPRPKAFQVLATLFDQGLVEIAKNESSSLDFVDFFQTKGPVTPSVEAAAKAKKQVAATTALLQQKGYTVRIARRARGTRPVGQSGTFSVMVVEDEQHLAGMLKHVLGTEGFEVRTAANREEILACFRKPPVPDLVLLDVTLPDADGFDVLYKMKQHPVLKNVLVVMLTAHATRDAVLKGLAGGADGYITKPFRIDLLTKAVRAVLGLPEPDGSAQDEDDPWAL